jgi:hypothetical protein
MIVKVRFLLALRRWNQARPYLLELRRRPELGLDTLFDSDYYRQTHHGRLPPLLHFILEGAFTGRDPHPLFDTKFYLRRYPEVAASGVNPLFHYLLHGAAEGRKPHPLFEPAYYVAQFPDTPDLAQPLLHFLKIGRSAGAQTHPLLDTRATPGPVTVGTQFGQDGV